MFGGSVVLSGIFCVRIVYFIARAINFGDAEVMDRVAVFDFGFESLDELSFNFLVWQHHLCISFH